VAIIAPQHQGSFSLVGKKYFEAKFLCKVCFPASVLFNDDINFCRLFGKKRF